jgi:hypothetical protein
MISGAGEIALLTTVRNVAAILTLIGKTMINGANSMPVILWLLGVPLTLVLVLMLVGVVHF